MPISEYFKGHGKAIKQSIRKAHPNYSKERADAEFYATANARGMKLKSHMPEGATMSPKGDLGQHRADEVRGAFPRPIKAAGRGNLKGLPYRRPETATDSKLSLPKDEVT